MVMCMHPVCYSDHIIVSGHKAEKVQANKIAWRENLKGWKSYKMTRFGLLPVALKFLGHQNCLLFMVDRVNH
jgi:hypothetical protein